MDYNFIQNVGRVQSVRLGSVDKFLYSIFSNTQLYVPQKRQKNLNFLTRLVLNRRITCTEDAAGDGASPAVSMLH
jgi:hypothetical protein